MKLFFLKQNDTNSNLKPVSKPDSALKHKDSTKFK